MTTAGAAFPEPGRAGLAELETASTANVRGARRIPLPGIESLVLLPACPTIGRTIVGRSHHEIRLKRLTPCQAECAGPGQAHIEARRRKIRRVRKQHSTVLGARAQEGTRGQSWASAHGQSGGGSCLPAGAVLRACSRYGRMLLAPSPDLSPAGFDMGLAWTGAFRLAGREAFEPD